MSQYNKEQIEKVIEENQNEEYPLRLVIKGEQCQTNHLNITDKQAKQIAKILC